MSEDTPQVSGEPWQALSSLADGQADADEQSRCLDQWAARADVRSRWHQYQVIGDVMRSDELGAGAASDAAFLLAFRDRMAKEPPRLIAATVTSPTAARRPAWLAPVAMAAGVGAVALTLTTLWPTSAPAPRDDVALAAQRAQASSAGIMPAPPQVHTVSGQLIRDARLDRYLAAHRQGGSGSALQMPGAVVRSVDTIVLDDK